jgi:hypothetical protein
MDPKMLTWIKFGLIGIALVGGFVLVAVGKLDASAMYQHSATMISALLLALGVASAGTSVRAALDHATTARLTMGKSPDAVHRGGDS